jgi:hypothetical protein
MVGSAGVSDSFRWQLWDLTGAGDVLCETQGRLVMLDDLLVYLRSV